MTEYLGDILNQRPGRVIVAQNSGSTTADSFDERVHKAKQDFASDPNLRNRLLVLPSEDNFASTIEHIQNTLEEGDVLVTIGGDGSASGAAHAVMGHPNKEIRETPILLLPGGNANLGSNDLLSEQGKKLSILEMLARGEVIDFRPMSLTIYSPMESSPRLEIAHFLSGMGISARAVAELEHDRFNPLRKNSVTRLAVDGASLIKGGYKQNHEPIDMTINGHEYESSAGILSVNVNKYAKIIQTPSKAEVPGFNSLVFPKSRLVNEISIVIRAIAKKEGWLETPNGDSLEIGIISKPGQIIGYEIDGEPRILPHDKTEEVQTRIKQEVSRQGVNMIRVKELNKDKQ